MSLMQQIHVGKRKAPPRLLVYGTEGIGKSTFAAQAPKTIFISTEDGLNQIDCASFPLAKKYTDVHRYLKALAAEDHEFETVVIDSCDWLEQLIWDDLCFIKNAATIEQVDGGYGKGYVAALRYWREIVELLSVLHEQRHMAAILIAHAKVERFEDPETKAYDRYSPQLHKKANEILTAWVDAILFATRSFSTKTEKSGFGKEWTLAVGIGENGGKRILRSVGSPACIAKNRYGLPSQFDLSWDLFMQYFNNPAPECPTASDSESRQSEQDNPSN